MRHPPHGSEDSPAPVLHAKTQNTTFPHKQSPSTTTAAKWTEQELMPSLTKVRVGRSSPKLTHKSSNDETKKTAVSKRTTGKRKIISDPAKGYVEDDDDEHVQPAKKKRAKKSPKKTEKRNVKEDTDVVELVVEEFSCPHCDKKFKSQPGCKYHVGEFLT